MRSFERILAQLPRCFTPPVWDGVHCDHAVHVSANLSLSLDSTLTSKHVHLLLAVFSSYWKRGGVWMCKLGVISQERLKTGVNPFITDPVKALHFAILV